MALNSDSQNAFLSFRRRRNLIVLLNVIVLNRKNNCPLNSLRFILIGINTLMAIILLIMLLSLSASAQNKLYYAKDGKKDVMVGFVKNDTIYTTDKDGRNPIKFGYMDTLWVYYTLNRKPGDPILEIVAGTIYKYDSEDGAWGPPATIKDHQITSPFGRLSGNAVIGFSDADDVKSLAAMILIQIESWRNSNSPFYNDDKK
jgi:hypothetical protein